MVTGRFSSGFRPSVRVIARLFGAGDRAVFDVWNEFPGVTNGAVGERFNKEIQRAFAGDIALAELATSIASELGHDIPRGSFPANSSSDHASFSQAGVAAITVHSGGDDFIHTAQDSIDTVFVEDLAILLEIATELLRTLLGD